MGFNREVCGVTSEEGAVVADWRVVSGFSEGGPWEWSTKGAATAAGCR